MKNKNYKYNDRREKSNAFYEDCERSSELQEIEERDSPIQIKINKKA
jgi:hypothetical protein